MIIKELINNYTDAFDMLKTFDPGIDDQIFDSLNQFYKLRHNLVLSFIIYTLETLVYDRDISWSNLFFVEEKSLNHFLGNDEYSYNNKLTPDLILYKNKFNQLSILNLGLNRSSLREQLKIDNGTQKLSKSSLMQGSSSDNDSLLITNHQIKDEPSRSNVKLRMQGKIVTEAEKRGSKQGDNTYNINFEKTDTYSKNKNTNKNKKDENNQKNERKKEKIIKKIKKTINYKISNFFIEKDDPKLFIMDVSVSTISNAERNKKTSKYNCLTERVDLFTNQHENFNSEIFIFNLNPSLTNLELVVQSFANLIGEQLFCDNFPYGQFRTIFNYAHQVYNSIKSHITDPSKLESFFNFEFSHVKKERDLFQTKEQIEADVKTMSAIFNNQIKMDNKAQCNQFNDTYTEIQEEELMDIFRSILSDHEIRDKYLETQTSMDKVNSSYFQIKSEVNSNLTTRFKPSIHTFAPFTQKILEPFGTLHTHFKRTEQQQIIKIMEQFSQLSYSDHEMESLKYLLKSMTDIFTDTGYIAPNVKLFETGKLGIDREGELEERFKSYNQKCRENNAPSFSRFKYFKDVEGVINIPDDLQSRSYRQKMLKLNMNKIDSASKDFIAKNHTAYKKVRERKEYNNSSVPLDSYKSVESYLERMSESLPYVKLKHNDLEEILNCVSEYDESVLKNIKLKMVNDYMPIFMDISKTMGFKMSYRQHLILKELNHISQFTLSPSTFTLFTAGCENVCFLVQNSYHNKGKDVGKAFLSFGYTDDIDEINELFGEVKKHVYKIRDRKFYFFMTSWRRLTTTKTVFLMDQFYSTLSTGMNAMLRHKDDFYEIMDDEERQNTIKHHFSLKVLVSLCSNQRTAELFSDFRYAIMASFSEFSELHTFIKDKFKPPFRTAIDSWILSRISHISLFLENRDTYRSQMRFKQPTFIGDKRKIDSIGGKFNMPSLWTGIEITDLQDLLDDMFLYVHTMKEPSSIHHENVKAVNTILKFQKMYDSTPSKIQKGELRNFGDFKEFFLSESIVGHSRDVLKYSCELMRSSFSKMQLEKDMINIFNEPLSSISSTKAAVPEYERVRVPITASRKKQNIIKQNIEQNKQRLKPLSAVKTKVPAISNLTGSLRSKVHDGLLDLMERGVAKDTVFSLSKWNVIQNQTRVVSDICIKAQYGAKREFYVINLGAKAMARILEEVFHKMCNYIDSEMISVPGDRKLLKMQEKINNFIRDKRQDEQIYFTNGDCTKWSAAETMECLINFLMGFRGLLPDYVIDYCKIVLTAWGKKDITIPTSILSNTFIVQEGLTEYLKDDNITLRSTQNFLQGMFNYLSSLKAVCCSDYTYKVWKKLNPNSLLKVDHLEHSDDYVMMMKSKSDKEINEFRLLHRLIMRCHGFNDSNKKTNTQQQMMEFISLVSMNGHMTYPQIKKAKETGLNVGCTGYRDDMDMAMSRVAECVRIGTPLTASYLMGKIHYINLYMAYSLNQKGTNGFQTLHEAMSMPTELFGIPDVHPLLLFLCKGSPNNYRLMKFGTNLTRKTIRYLFDSKTVVENHKDLQFDVDIDQSIRLYHPTYTFDLENKMIKKIRYQIGKSYHDVNTFWDEHKTLNFLKPRSAELFLPWLQNMYFKENFALAYSRNSRANITLRLSSFVSTKCLLHTLKVIRESPSETKQTDLKDIPAFSIKEYVNDIKGAIEISSFKGDELDNKSEVALLRCLMNCDSTITSVYSMFQNSKIIETNRQTKETIAALSPMKPNWINIDSEASSLLQYIFNPDDFIKDKRFVKSLSSLEADKAELQKNYLQTLGPQSDLTTIKFVYNDIINAKQRRVLCMSYSNDSLSVEEYAKRHIEFGTTYGRIYRLYSPGVTESINPNTGEYYFQKNVEFTKNEFRLLIDDLTLTFAFLKYSIGLSNEQIKETLPKIKQLTPHTGRTVTISNLLNHNVEMLLNTGFNQQELKCFTFLKSFMYNDDTDLRQFMESKYNYKYNYGKFVNLGTSLNYEQCHIKYNDSDSVVIYEKVQNKLIVLCNNIKKGDIVSLFFIAMKVFNLISLKVLEKNVHNMSIRSFLNSDYVNYFKSTLSIDQINTFNIIGSYKVFLEGFHYDSEDFVDKIALCYNCKSLPLSKSAMETSNISKIIDIDIDRASVYFGKLKVFTLPFLACKQSNLSSTDDDVNCNGLQLNWWLKSNRIYDFVHGRSMSVTKQDFRKIGEFEIKEANYSFKKKLKYIHEKMKLIPRFDKSEKISVENFEPNILMNINEESSRVIETDTKELERREKSKKRKEELESEIHRMNLENNKIRDDTVQTLKGLKSLFLEIGIDLDELFKAADEWILGQDQSKFDSALERLQNILEAKEEKDKYLPPFHFTDPNSEKEYGKFPDFFEAQVYKTKEKFKKAGFIDEIPPEELHIEIIGYLLEALSENFPGLIEEDENAFPIYLKNETKYMLIKEKINKLIFHDCKIKSPLNIEREIVSKDGKKFKVIFNDDGQIILNNKETDIFLSDINEDIDTYLEAVIDYESKIRGIENIKGLDSNQIKSRINVMTDEIKIEFSLIQDEDSESEFEGEYEEEIIIHQSSSSGEEKLELIQEPDDDIIEEKQELNWKEFQTSIPKQQRFELYYNKVDPSSILRLKAMGDPTRYIIDQYFINPRLVSNIRPHEKIVLLRQLKLLFDKEEFLTDVEKYLATHITIILLEDIFRFREIEVSEDVYILPNLHGFNMFLKLENFNDRELIEHVLKNTFLVDYKLIDINKNQVSESFLMGKTVHVLLKDHIYERIIDTEKPFKIIHNLTEMKVINDAFKRLYDSKFNKYHRFRELLGLSYTM